MSSRYYLKMDLADCHGPWFGRCQNKQRRKCRVLVAPLCLGAICSRYVYKFQEAWKMDLGSPERFQNDTVFFCTKPRAKSARTHMRTNSHLNTHTHTHSSMYVCMSQTCVSTYLPTYLPACLPACLPAYLHTYIHTYIHTYMRTCIHCIHCMHCILFIMCRQRMVVKTC